jgi:molybdopterin molybdotransferase
VTVGRAPVIGIISTGSELRRPGETLAPGQIYESNRLTLAALSSACGALPRIYPLVSDDLAATESALSAAFEECDAVVSSGGISVGEKDLVKAAFQEIKGQLAFWRVAVKPGKPFALGQCDGKLLFGLPGNPVSAFVTFLLLVRPALLKFQHAADLTLPARFGTFQESLANPGDRRHFVRVHIDPSGQVRSAGPQASHRLFSLACSNGLVDVPANGTLAPGDLVKVLSWD